MTRTLTITALTSGGLAYDIDFPLHPNTRSSDAVASLVTAQLATIGAAVAAHPGLSDGDILQALTMTLGVRARMAGAAPESMKQMVHDLFDGAYGAALASTPTLAGRA
jgi:hypothetical protein